MKTTNPDDDCLFQLSNSITSIEGLDKLLTLTEEEKQTIKKLPLRITPYYLDLVKKDKTGVLRKTVVPTIHELEFSEDESIDPLDEDKYKKTRCLIHKYENRVLFLVTNFCSTNCRYCTRSRIIDKKRNYTKDNWDEAIAYIQKHEEVTDVLISGGDPLTLKDSQLKYLLSNIRKIKHVKIIRIGTKVPVVMPQRITEKLCEMLKQYHPLYINIHCTHPLELTKECRQACNMLANAGIPLGSQTVLLKGINDNPEVMVELMNALLEIRVKPYYLYQVDKILGSGHFRTSLETGKEIISELRKSTTGMAVPTFILDSTENKIPIYPG
jgi:lysine 2,3-aminomutase